MRKHDVRRESKDQDECRDEPNLFIRLLEILGASFESLYFLVPNVDLDLQCLIVLDLCAELCLKLSDLLLHRPQLTLHPLGLSLCSLVDRGQEWNEKSKDEASA